MEAPMKNQFLTLLTTSLLPLTPSSAQASQLDAWADLYLPDVVAKAQAVVHKGFDFGALGQLAAIAVKAAQELKGLFSGTSRARIAQAVFVTAVRAALPDNLEHWIVPLLSSDTVAALIEAAFRQEFGAPAAVPVVDASDVEPGSVQ
jgi:hypothetical protein